MPELKARSAIKNYNPDIVTSYKLPKNETKKLSRGHDQKAKNFQNVTWLTKIHQPHALYHDRFLYAHASTKNHILSRTAPQ